jgi:hypothetical protein
LAWCCRKPAWWLGLELWLALRLGRLTELLMLKMPPMNYYAAAP